MMHHMLVLAAALALPLAAQAEELDLIGDGTAWSCNLDGPGPTLTQVTTQDALLAATISGDGGTEQYPKMNLGFPEPQDWRRFTRMNMRLRVTCDAPGVAYKSIAFVLYDRDTRREDLPDRPITQQVIAHSVPVNQWVEYRDWLADINRQTIVQMAVYIYERPLETPHEYRWEVSRLRLEGVGLEATVLDTEGYGKDELSGAAGRAVGSVQTASGLRLTLDDGGGVASVHVGGDEIGVVEGRPTGLLWRDATRLDPPTMAGGTMAIENGVARQQARSDEMGLSLDATWRAAGDKIEVSGVVRNLTAGDRAVTVLLALPLSPEPWQWWDSVASARSGRPQLGEFSYVERGMDYGLNGVHSKYPIGVVSLPDKAGLTLGVRMDEPVVHRISYSPDLSLFVIALDFGLTDMQTIRDRSLNEAPFRFLVYSHDPAWGFRSALQRYYEFFPEFFTKRVAREGGWYVWGDMKDTEGALEAGFGFHWGPVGPEAVKWDNDRGVLSVLYIEPELYQQTMGDHEKAPTIAQGLERLTKLAAGDAEELAKFAELGYASSYVPANWVVEHSRDEASQLIARAALQAAQHGPSGGIQAGVGQYSWMTESKWGVLYPCNLDPDVPEGKGWFARHVYIDYGLRAVEAAGAHYDGVGLDSFGGYGQLSKANYRREHFQYTDTPLSFSASTRQPVLVAAFSSVEWLKDLAEYLHGRGLITMTNCSWGTTPGWLTFAAPYLDVFGAEATQFADPDFIRAIAGQKSCTDLPYNPRPAWEVPWHMLHGIFLGHGNDLEAMKEYADSLRRLAGAGWEPITHAKAASEAVRVERFGAGETVYLVAHNTTDDPVSTTLSIDSPALGMEGVVIQDRAGNPCETTDEGLALDLAGHETRLLVLHKP